MVDLTIATPKSELLKGDDFKEVDKFIDDMIAKHSKNSEMMNVMALEASSLATSVESRSKGLESQGFLKRTFRNITGSNQKVSARNQRDLAQGQYLGQQMLNKLADNNLMTYQMVVALGDKLNRVVDDGEKTRLELVKINQSLATFFSNIRQKLEQKFTSLERNDDLLFWKETMAFEAVYKGKTYSELERPEKMICLANEFYRHSHQQWSPRDLSFLKSIMVQIGHHPDEKVQLKEVFQCYQEDNGLLKQLFLGIDESPEIHKTAELTPTLMAFSKLRSFNGEESHIVDTITQFSPDTSREDASLVLTEKYIENQTGRNFSQDISIFDGVMNLVEDLTFYKLLQAAELAEKKQELLENEENLISIKKHEEELIVVENTMIEIPKNTITSQKGFMKFTNGQVGKLKSISLNSSFFDSQKKVKIIPKNKNVLLIGLILHDYDVGVSYDVGFEESGGDFHLCPAMYDEHEQGFCQPRVISDVSVFPVSPEEYAYANLEIIVLDIFDELKNKNTNNYTIKDLNLSSS